MVFVIVLQILFCFVLHLKFVVTIKFVCHGYIIFQNMTPVTFLEASPSSSPIPRSRPCAHAMRAPCTMLPTWTADGVTSEKSENAA